MIRRDFYPDERLLALVLSDPALKAAAAFGDNFNPNTEAFEKGLYDWVIDLAPKLWESRLATYQKLDDRAASVLTWVSSATGLFTGGIALAVADDKLPWGIALFFLPAIICAIMAAILVLHSRIASDLFPPPDVRDALVFVGQCYPKGRAAILSQWHKAITRLTTVSNYRAAQISSSLWWAAVATALLVLPLAAVVIGKATGVLTKAGVAQ